MSLSDLSIRRPVLTWMMTLALATFGTLGFLRLGIDLFPDIEFPFVGMMITLEGADPETMEKEVADIVEESMVSIEGMREIRTISGSSRTAVMMEFELGTDVDVAAQDVRDKVMGLGDLLPSDIEPPVIGKWDFNAFPIVYVPISSDLPPTETTEYVDRHLRPPVESIPGAAAADIYGKQERNIRIWIDPDALRARGLAASDVLTALRREHVERPGGFLEGPEVEWSVKTAAEFSSIDELGAMVVSWDGEAPIRLRDVARLEDGAEDMRGAAHINGKAGVALGLSKKSNGNGVAIVDELMRRMDRLRPGTPEGIEIAEREGFIDQTTVIRESFEETMFALVYGGMLAVFVVFVFMRRTRPTLIVAAAIPLSLITSFGMIWLFDFTLNTSTLLGLTLAIGVVIDDAIIVLENIERHREGGESAWDAAVIGTREITFAAAAATFSVAAVFLPVVFATGQMGKMLAEFGVTVSVAVLVSLFVALSLTPMLAARMPPPKERGPDSIYQRLEVWFRGLERRYEQILDWSLAHRAKTAGIAFASIGLAVLAGTQLDSEFMPSQDTGFMLMDFRTPPGTSLEATEAVLGRIEDWFLSQPDVAALFARIGGDRQSTSGVNEGKVNAVLAPHDQRERSLEEFEHDARLAMAKIPGMEFAILGGTSGSAREFQVMIAGNGSLAELDRYAKLMMDRLAEQGGLVDLDSDLRLGLPEARIVPDREKAAAVGVDAATLADIVQAMIGGLDIGTFRDGEDRHDIRMRLEAADRGALDAIEGLWVRARNGELVDLRNLVTIQKGASASSISRTDRLRTVEVSANLNGIALEEAVSRANEIADEILPPHLQLRLSGYAESMEESAREFTLLIVLAVLVIYMVLASQFESFTQPLIVMLALPFSMTGALGGLWLLGLSLNVFSMIGLVLLIGLVTKNSILLIDYANQLKERGETAAAAIRRAAPVRMRPVLMTALSMIFGVLPAALGLGPGAELRQPMAVATAAGMFSSMLLTLVVVPVFYLGLDDLVRWVRSRSESGWRSTDPQAHRV